MTLNPSELELAARRFHAISDETRLDLVRTLARGERCVCELTDALDASQSRLSFHLKTLKVAGIVNDRREGRWVYYSLNPEVLESMAGYLTATAEEFAAAPGSGCCR